MSVQDTLKAILADPNIPDNITEQAVELLLDEYCKVEEDMLDVVWHTLFSDENNNLQLCGPTVSITNDKVRVARVLSLSNLIDYYLNRVFALSFSSEARQEVIHWLGDEEKDATLFLTGAWRGHRHIVWTSLYDEVRDSSPDEIRNGLGMIGFDKQSLVYIAYNIEKQYLKVPTVLDAAMYPSFVSKSQRASNLPRAWDFVRGSWGLSEFVHASEAPITDPVVGYLGTPSSNHPSIDLLQSVTPVYSKELEETVQQVLRQVCAHKGLASFISGESDIMSLTHREYEEFLGLLYLRRGYRTLVTQAAHDGGFDVIAFSDIQNKKGVLIQAKHTRNTVGITIIRELIGARYLASKEFVDFFMVVATTGKFSREARQAEKQLATELKLIDYETLREELKSYQTYQIKDVVERAMKYRKRYENPNIADSS